MISSVRDECEAPRPYLAGQISVATYTIQLNSQYAKEETESIFERRRVLLRVIGPHSLAPLELYKVD